MNRPMDVSAVQAREATFFAQVYQWMAAGLGVTALSSFVMLAYPPILQLMLNMWIVVMIAQLGIVFYLSSRIMTLSRNAALTWFFVYAALNGQIFAAIFLIYTGGSIVSTMAITAGTFIVFSIYGHTTKKDLSSMGGLLLMALIGIIIASIVNIFLQSPALYWLVTYIAVGVAIGLIAYKTQYLKKLNESGMGQEGNLAVYGALSLYITLVFLFINLIRIFGQRR